MLLPELFLLVRADIFAGYRAVDHVASEHSPSRYRSGAFEMLPAPVTVLRRNLLAMCTDVGVATPTSMLNEKIRAY
ncbi:hypothetical protein CCL23_05280 [Pseudomonas syringae]|nr:hypothetical protein CCL23_05280 [Pseudomonas syringae]